KLSNEELDLVVGGNNYELGILDAIKMIFWPAGGIADLKIGGKNVEATWKSILGRYGALTLLAVVPAAATYFCTKKKDKKKP
ncbi:MAG: hypothetical protein J6K87_00765, partial [Clostridia bacterium]|nr:hypothetical protein [Clostridia bacterium]